MKWVIAGICLVLAAGLFFGWALARAAAIGDEATPRRRTRIVQGSKQSTAQDGARSEVWK